MSQPRGDVVLTVRQPWASLIVSGIKTVENRTWSTTHRGRLLIHAGSNKARTSAAATAFGEHPGYYPLGVVIGSVDVVDVVRDSGLPYAVKDHWHWILANPVAFDDPIPASGSLGLWRITLGR